jgi:metallophosphoesterase superfamily enzyme
MNEANQRTGKQPLNPDNVLVIGDLHLPYDHKDYLQFCIDQQERFNCGTVVFIGDILDFHSSSFHATDPDLMGAGAEYDTAIHKLKSWQAAFPNAIVTIGNHDLIPMRKAFASGLSKKLMPTWHQIFDAPTGWKFAKQFVLNDILYTHGTSNALNKMTATRLSVVQGHLHSLQYVQWTQSDLNRIFACQVGCGVDAEHMAFAYGRDFAKRPVLGCAVVLDKGKLPIVIPMHEEKGTLDIWC